MRIAENHVSALFTALVLMAIYVSSAACSLPNLETAECASARNAVKRFYSLHFANQLNPTPEYVAIRDEYLSERLKGSLFPTEENEDYFTKTRDFPKAFRVGTCTSDLPDNAVLQVVLLWRDDVRNEQAEVRVNAVKLGSEWLIDSVEK